MNASERGIRPIQFVRLLRLAGAQGASKDDRAWALSRLVDVGEMVRKDDVLKTIDRLTPTHPRLRATLKKRLQVILNP
jgi:hypothetical protein